MQPLSSKERILTAMRGEKPDRVPVQLGVTNMFAVLQQGHDAWDVYWSGKVPLWKVTTDVFRRFGLDGYLYLTLESRRAPGGPEVATEREVVLRTDDRIVERNTVRTPRKDLVTERTYLRYETPTVTRGPVRDAEDFQVWLEYCLAPAREYGFEHMLPAIEYLGQDGTAAGCVGIPGLAALVEVFEDRLAGASYLAYDRPDLLEQYREIQERHILRQVEVLLEAPVDYIQLGSSGMLTLSSPELFRTLCLPTIRKVTAMCRQAGVLTELHCCGKERLVVQSCHDQTDLDSINPLQPPPMGDCDLAEVKRSCGAKLRLKGNVGVTWPLLTGSPDDVERDVIRCMEAAKAGGGYVLFSEEGIGARTPVDNVRRFVEAGERHGRY